MRSRDHDNHDHAPEQQQAPMPGFELPPGATFEPDPQAALAHPAPHDKDKHAP
jgi:putative (di)nucleoside polyphosphate hydrolase